MPEKDGVILEARNAAKFISDMKAATKAYQGFLNVSGKTAAAGSPFAAAAKGAGGSLARLFKGFDRGVVKSVALGTAIGKLAGGLVTLGVKAAGSAIQGIQRLTQGLKGLLQESVMTAARVNEMGLVTQLVGQRAGFSSKEIDDYTQSVIDAGIRTDIAQNLIAQMARQQLDLSQASKLARVAQDAAVLSMADSSETLARIQYGIQTYQTEVLRTAGLNINMQKSFKDAAAALDKDTSSLTEAEKQQAALNAVLAEGAKIAGTYELAMESPAKALRSLPRYFWEIKNSIGAPFQDAFGTVVKTITKLTKTLMAAVREGGALYPLLVKLGAVASIVADGFAALVDRVLPFFTSIADKIDSTFTGLADKALNWGANIIVQLGKGIISAAKSVLTFAIKQIGKLLTGWLAPRSPPRVAPKLREWGVGWIAELFTGVPDAMKGALGSIQGPLQDLFEGPDFAKISKRLTGLLNAGDRGGVLETLTKTDKDFGPILADMAQSEFDLADAIDAVTQAEKDLQAAQERSLATQGKMSEATDIYNEMLREGADQKALDAQLARINAAEEERRAALEAEKAAGAGLEQRQAAADAAGEESDRLQEVFDQLMMYNRALTEQEKAPLVGALGGGGGAAAALKDLVMGDVGEIDIGGAIGSAVDAAKDQIKGKLKELIGQISGELGPEIESLKTRWSVFTEHVRIAWDAMGSKVKTIYENKIEPKLNDIQTWFQKKFPVAAHYGGKIIEQVMNGDFKGALQTGLDWLDWFKNYTVIWWTTKGQPAFQKFADDIGPILREKIPGHGYFMADALQNIADGEWKAAWETLGSWADWFTNYIAIWRVAKFDPFWNDLLALFSSPEVKQALQDFNDSLSPLAESLEGLFDVLFEETEKPDALGDLLTFMQNIVAMGTGFLAVATDVAEGLTLISGGITSLVNLGEKFQEYWGSDDAPGPIALRLLGAFPLLGQDVVGALDSIQSGADKFNLQNVATQAYTTTRDTKQSFEDLNDDLVGNSIIPDMMQSIFDSITGGLSDTVDWIMGEEHVETWRSAASNLVQSFWTGFKTKWEEFKGWLTLAWQSIEKIYNVVTGSGSPSTVFIQHGKELVESVAMGMRSAMPEIGNVMAGINPTLRTAGSTGSVYRPSSSVTNQSNQFSFNTSVNSGIDQVSFEAAVMRVIGKALAGAA